MNKNDTLMVPYYQSDYWKNLLTVRLQTLKEDSLLLKEHTSNEMTTKRRNTAVTMRSQPKQEMRQTNLPSINSVKKDILNREITNSFPFEGYKDNFQIDQPVFRHTATAFSYLKMKERWRHKSNMKEKNNMYLTTLKFPSAIHLNESKKGNETEENKKKYLQFLKQKGLMKTNIYYN